MTVVSNLCDDKMVGCRVGCEEGLRGRVERVGLVR